MSNIGNDIVDLDIANEESNWQRPGFLEKQFTAKEQEVILKSNDSSLQVWLFWSMKEAAYKCYTQKVEKRFFAPKKFECRLISEDQGLVTFENHKFYTTSFFRTFYIHTIAEDILVEDNDKVRMFLAIGAPETIDNDLKNRLSIKTGTPSSAIEKSKTAIGAPVYYHKEKKLTESCSISHHGNYGAFVFTLENES